MDGGFNELKCLEPAQRKRFRDLVDTCHSLRGKSVYFQELLTNARLKRPSFAAIITGLRLGADHSALCELREALACCEIEDPDLERAIRRVENEKSPTKGTIELENIKDFDLKPIHRAGATSSSPLREEQPRPKEGQKFSGKQQACLVISEILAEFKGDDVKEIMRTVEQFTALRE